MGKAGPRMPKVPSSIVIHGDPTYDGPLAHPYEPRLFELTESDPQEES